MNNVRSIRIRTIAAVFVAALTARLLFCFVAIPRLGLSIGPNSPDFYDSTDGYVEISRTLAETGRFAFAADAPPTTYRAPVFPAVLAATFRLTGDMANAVMIVNCIASALTCVVVYLIAARLIGARATFWFMLPVTLFPLSIYYCASSFSDTFLAFTIVLYLYSCLVLFGAPSIGKGMFSGAAWSAACLTKAVVLPMPLVLVAYALVRLRKAMPALAASIVVGLIPIAAWTFRNHSVSGHVVPITGGTGYNMLVGNFMTDESRDCDTSLSHGRKEARRYLESTRGVVVETDEIRPQGFLDVPRDIDRLHRNAAVEMWKNDPMLVLKKLGINAARFWYFSSSPKKSLANGIVNFGVLAFSLIALPILWRTRPLDVEVLVLFTTAFIALYALIIMHSSRFSLPIVMPLTAVATVGMLSLLPRWRRSLGETVETPLDLEHRLYAR